MEKRILVILLSRHGARLRLLEVRDHLHICNLNSFRQNKTGRQKQILPHVSFELIVNV